MKRHIFQSLTTWQHKKDRKPLIIKGARQIGKTYILKELGKNQFPAYFYINFERDQTLHQLFKKDLAPARLLSDLNFYFRTTINPNQDLLIFDEIQACPNALTSLKYFHEEMPELALTCAGSLLGITLNAGSFPVGKVDFLNMYPMTFLEFLLGTGEDQLYKLLNHLTLESEIPLTAHNQLWDYFKLYLIIGGLPEIVNYYAQNKQNLNSSLLFIRQKQSELILAYYADIAKHSGKINAMHIDRVWRSVPNQLSTQHNHSARRFTFKGIIPGIDRYSRLANVIDWLETANLLVKQSITHCAQLPLSAYTKENIFKLFMFDVGLLGAMIDLSPKVILDYDYGSYKGYFAENFVAQAFLASGLTHLYSWHEGSSEIEFLKEVNGLLLPVEVKSGWVTQAKSLKVFNDKYHPPYRTIFSAKNLLIDKKNLIHYYPLYLAERFPLPEN
ncbi:MAG: hypothetical protein A3E87_08710 [Gammaproteobacteria bacterium RIFCSPHIGHO2_12_FULL_35_23]|nr:MAG: hypothetical protein A3E87_08710 [Gammaproteobacteria bacterium RIFCSPHIGHO2_12_FULL_35_23]